MERKGILFGVILKTELSLYANRLSQYILSKDIDWHDLVCSELSMKLGRGLMTSSTSDP